MQELLLVFTGDRSAEALAEIQSRYQITGMAPPRLAIVVADESQIGELRRLAGVESVLTDSTTPLPNSLDASERLFAQAWQLRQQSGGKHRRGEGLRWDAEGFLPPDKPHEH
jgi:hypothetical protein